MTVDELITELLRRQDELTRIRTATELLPGRAKTTTGLGDAITAVDRCVERLKRAIEDASGGAAPAWNRSLDGYEPCEGDWVLYRWGSGVNDDVFRTCVDGDGLFSDQIVVAFWRPPAPPEVPE